MKLNPTKCAFEVGSGKFLRFMVNNRGIEANPSKVQALLDLQSPKIVKDIQKLTRMIVALSHFVARSMDKCHPFFQALKMGKNLIWTADCEEAFQKIKQYVGGIPVLAKPRARDDLTLYLSVFKHAVSGVLVRDEGTAQTPIYYVSKALHDVETRYSEIEKLVLALVIAARKLIPYFQACVILVSTSHPLQQVLQNPKVSGRLTKWAIELEEFDIKFMPKMTVKGQAVADFVAEFTYPTNTLGMTTSAEHFKRAHKG